MYEKFGFKNSPNVYGSMKGKERVVNREGTVRERSREEEEGDSEGWERGQMDRKGGR